MKVWVRSERILDRLEGSRSSYLGLDAGTLGVVATSWNEPDARGNAIRAGCTSPFVIPRYMAQFEYKLEFDNTHESCGEYYPVELKLKEYVAINKEGMIIATGRTEEFARVRAEAKGYDDFKVDSTSNLQKEFRYPVDGSLSDCIKFCCERSACMLELEKRKEASPENISIRIWML